MTTIEFGQYPTVRQRKQASSVLPELEPYHRFQPSIVLIPKPAQPYKRFWLHMTILDTLGPSNTQVTGNLIPHLAVVESPPLPGSVLATEALDDLLPSRMAANIEGTV